MYHPSVSIEDTKLQVFTYDFYENGTIYCFDFNEKSVNSYYKLGEGKYIIQLHKVNDVLYLELDINNSNLITSSQYLKGVENEI